MSLVERLGSGVPAGETVPGLACSEAAPGVDPFILLMQAHEAVRELHDADLSELDSDWFIRFVESTDELRNATDAVCVDVAGEVERRGHGREVGFFSTKAWLKHHVRLSGPEARARMQVARLFALLPEWADMARAGRVGVEQTRLMARVAANPRIHDAVVEHGEELLDDAMFDSYDLFERRVRGFERPRRPRSGETDRSTQP